MQELTAYIDGACSGNPGRGGWAYHIVFSDGTAPMTVSGASQFETTNNRAELYAAIALLTKVSESFAVRGQVLTVHADSQYVVKGFTEWLPGWMARGWRTGQNKPVENVDLWKRLHALYVDLAAMMTVRFVWVRGHDGNAGNEICDKAAVAASQRASALARPADRNEFEDAGMRVALKPSPAQPDNAMSVLKDVASFLQGLETTGTYDQAQLASLHARISAVRS